MAFLRNFLFLSPFIRSSWDRPNQVGNGAEPDLGGKTFDYIIVGGGLTGLTVANRLSEDSGRK